MVFQTKNIRFEHIWTIPNGIKSRKLDHFIRDPFRFTLWIFLGLSHSIY